MANKTLGRSPRVGRHGALAALPAILALAALLATPVLVDRHPTSATAAGGASTCRVRNLTHRGTFRSLPAAVRAARDRDRLQVRGTCVGETTIRKRITILGRPTGTMGPPILRGKGLGPVLEVLDRGSLRLTGVTIEGPWTRVVDHPGGGIRNAGSVTLTDVTVRGSRTRAAGGGIFNDGGVLRLAGTTSVSGNEAREGGGIASLGGTVTLSDSSVVSGNRATGSGGGVHTTGSLSLEDASSISGNTAGSHGGGIEDAGATLRGVRCAPAPGANVRDNAPDDCGPTTSPATSVPPTAGPAATAAPSPSPASPSPSPEASPETRPESLPAARFIELELAAGQVLQDGEPVRDIPVVPGETVRFRIDNTGGLADSFSIGRQAQLAVPGGTTDTGIPPWSTGVRELEWTVPAGVDDLRFGSTVEGRDLLMRGTFTRAEARQILPALIPDLDAASDTGSPVAGTTTTILRPDADASATGLTYSSGSSAWDLLDEETVDTSDHVQVGDGGFVFVSFPKTGLPGDQVIAQVVLRANVSNAAPAGEAWLAVRRATNGEVDSVLALPQNVGADQTITLTARPWDEQPWTAADVDTLEVGIVGPASLSSAQLRQLWAEVTYATRTPAGWDTDNVTADSTPTLSGLAASGTSRVDMYDDYDHVGVDLAPGGGTWSISSERLDDGVHRLWARITDGTGEITDTGTLAVTIVTEGSAMLTAESDTGPLVPSPGILVLRPDADVALSGIVTLSAGSTAWNLVDEARLRVSDNVVVVDGSAAMSFPASGLSATDRIDSITVRASVRNPAPAMAGTLFVRDPGTSADHVVDTISQNPDPDRSVTLTSRPWDGQPWSVSDVDALQVGVACDCASFPKLHLDQLWVEVAYTTLTKGASGSDGVTSDTTPTLTGTSSTTADRVDVIEDGVVIATDASVTDGTWEVTLPTLTEGEHTLQVEAYDEAGILTGGAPDLHVTVDVTVPSGSPTPDLDASSDEGRRAAGPFDT